MVKLPEWVNPFLEEWKNILCLHEWEIATVLTERFNNENETIACVECTAEYLTAVIQIKNTIPKESESSWERAIIHELLHIRTARLDNFVERLYPGLSMSAQMFAREQWSLEIEPFIQVMTSTLYKLAQERQK